MTFYNSSVIVIRFGFDKVAVHKNKTTDADNDSRPDRWRGHQAWEWWSENLYDFAEKTQTV